jgi:hypothetical protein
MLSEPTAASTPRPVPSTPHRHRRPTTVRLVAALAALALLASGCGLFSSDDDDASTSTTVAGVPAGPDDGLAGDALITVDSFPTGWSAEGVNAGLVDGIIASFPECAGVTAALTSARSTATGSAGPVSFTSGNDRYDVRIQIFADEAAAAAIINEIKGSDPAACEAAVTRRVAPNLGLTSEDVEATYEADTVGDASANTTVVGQSDTGTRTAVRGWILSGRAVLSIYQVIATPDAIDGNAVTEQFVSKVNDVLGG